MPTPTAASRPPPSPNLTAAEGSAAATWHQLDGQVRQSLVILLARMILNHLPGPEPGEPEEVGDECR